MLFIYLQRAWHSTITHGQNYIIVKLRYNERNNVNNIYDHEDL